MDSWSHNCQATATQPAAATPIMALYGKTHTRTSASGIIKQAPVGYSWTTLLFPSLPALLRGDFKGFLLQAILNCLLIPILIFPSLYNKQYIQKLLSAGFKVTTTEGISLEEARQKLGINLPSIEAGRS